MIFPFKKMRFRVGAWLLLAAMQSAWCATSIGEAAAQEEALRQAEIQRRTAERRQEQSAAPAVRSAAPRSTQGWRPVPNEQPCFVVQTLELTGPDAQRFAWLQYEFSPFIGHCIGIQSVESLTAHLNDKLLEAGWITTRVQAEPQDLSTGILKLRVLAGRIGRVALKKIRQKNAEDNATTADSDSLSPFALTSILPAPTGDLLNIHDLDQAAENIESLPGNKLRLVIEPGEQPGTSTLAGEWQQARRWRAGLGVDNSSSKAMGRTRVQTNLALDDLLGMADQLSGTVSSNAEDPGPERRSMSYSLRYTIPWRYHRFSASHVSSRFGQTVEGTATRFLSTGRDSEDQFRWEWTFYRGGRLKLGSEASSGNRQGFSRAQDVELITQRRNARFMSLGLNADWRDGASALQTTISETRTMRVTASDERIFHEGESARAFGRRWSGQFSHQWSWKDSLWSYSVSWDVLGTRHPTPLSDVISLGGRYSVRGFSGDEPLLTSDGAWLRQELQAPALSLPCSDCAIAPYFGIDAGRAWGSTAPASDRYVSGFAVGLRVYAGKLSADFALASPWRGLTDRPRPHSVPYVSINLAL